MDEAKKAGRIFPTLKVGDRIIPVDDRRILRGCLVGIKLGNIRITGRNEHNLPIYEATPKGLIDLKVTTFENKGLSDEGHR